MKKRFKSREDWEAQRDKLLGLGESSIRKSYYPELRERLTELESTVDKLNKAQAALAKSERQFREIFEDVNLAVFIVNMFGKVMFFNRFLQKLTGYSPEETVGKDFQLWVDYEDQEDFTSLVTGIITGRTRAPGSHEEKLVTKKGAVKIVNWREILLHNEDGTIRGVACIGEDVTEKRAAEKQRFDFYAMVSHDMESPLANIAAYSGMAAEEIGVKPSEEVRDKLMVVHRNARMMLDLVSDYVVFANSELGGLELNIKGVKVEDFLNKLLQEIKPVKRKSVEIILDIPPGLPDVEMDEHLIRRALTNLLYNAVAYSKKDGNVVLRVRAEDSMIIFSVEDFGAGIPEDEMKKVFDKYYRLSQSARRRAGVGLAIVKFIAETHGGRVEVQSELGKGSRFRLIIPVSAAARKAA